MRKFIGFLLIVSAVFIASISFQHYAPILEDYQSSKNLYREIKDQNTTEPDISQPEIEALLLGVDHNTHEYDPIKVDNVKLSRQNPDYVGWIYIPKTEISYPVVKSKDNNDYLHTDFNKNYSFPGTIFMDCDCSKGVLNHHTILYGHNMNNGTMFAGIRAYRQQDFADEHPVFWFITPDYTLLYQVFAVCDANPYDRTQYGIDGIDYKDNAEFKAAMDTIIERSVVKLNKEVMETDYIMTLSTCTGNSSVRCAVHGVLLGALASNAS